MSAVWAPRERRLRALGVEPLQWRARPAVVAAAEPPVAPVAVEAVAPAGGIRRLALQPDRTALQDPAVHAMYTALTAAVSKAGLQNVRVCDVADDATAAVMVFGDAPLPEGVPAVRILRADPLAVLHADRERKRLLWEQLQALGRNRSD